MSEKLGKLGELINDKGGEKKLIKMIGESLFNNFKNQPGYDKKSKEKIKKGIEKNLKKKKELFENIKILINEGKSIPLKLKKKKIKIDKDITSVGYLFDRIKAEVDQVKNEKKIKELKKSLSDTKEKAKEDQVNMLSVRGRPRAKKLAMNFSKGGKMKLKFEKARRKSLDNNGKLDNVLFIHNLMKSFNRSFYIRGIGAIKGTFGYNSLGANIGKNWAAKAFGNEEFKSTMTKGQKKKFDTYVKSFIKNLKGLKDKIKEKDKKAFAKVQEIDLYIGAINKAKEEMNHKEIKLNLYNTNDKIK